MDWRAVLRNRWTWLAAGAGVLAGGVVYVVRRGRGGQTGTGTPTVATQGYGPAGSGYFDSIATDVAEQLGQREAAWQQMFTDFTGDVTEQLAALGNEGPAAPTGPAPATPAASGPTWFGRTVPTQTYTTRAGETIASIYNRFQPINPQTGKPAGPANLYRFNAGPIHEATGFVNPDLYATQSIPAGTKILIPAG